MMDRAYTRGCCGPGALVTATLIASLCGCVDHHVDAHSLTFVAFDTSSGKPLDFLLVRWQVEYSGTVVVPDPSNKMSWSTASSSGSVHAEVLYVLPGTPVQIPEAYDIYVPFVLLWPTGGQYSLWEIIRPGYEQTGCLERDNLAILYLTPVRGHPRLAAMVRFAEKTISHLDRKDPLARLVLASEAANLELVIRNRNLDPSEQAQAEACLKKLQDAVAEFQCSPAELTWPPASAEDAARARDLLAKPSQSRPSDELQAVVTLWHSGDEESLSALRRCLGSEDQQLRPLPWGP
jgi:hypothetical protein